MMTLTLIQFNVQNCNFLKEAEESWFI